MFSFDLLKISKNVHSCILIARWKKIVWDCLHRFHPLNTQRLHEQDARATGSPEILHNASAISPPHCVSDGCTEFHVPKPMQFVWAVLGTTYHYHYHYDSGVEC